MTLRLARLLLVAVRLSRRWPDVRLLFGPRVSRALWRRRMRTCLRCPLFEPGTYRCAALVGFREMGCGCSMPVKALFKKSTCWGRDHGFEYGWEN
jgi:hypothetical protein